SYNKNKNIIPKTMNNEIELTLFNIPVSCFSNMYYYIKDKDSNQKQTYFELKAGNEVKKYRQKIKFEEFKTYNIKNIKIGLTDDKSIWNTKEIKTKDDLIIDDILIGDIKHSIEFDEKLYSNIFMSSKIGVIF